MIGRPSFDAVTLVGIYHFEHVDLVAQLASKLRKPDLCSGK